MRVDRMLYLTSHEIWESFLYLVNMFGTLEPSFVVPSDVLMKYIRIELNDYLQITKELFAQHRLEIDLHSQ